MLRRRLTGLRDPVPLWSAAAVLAIAIAVLLAGAPVAWLLLGITAVAALAVLLPAIWEGRFLEPLPVIAAIVLFYFVLRALQLLLSASDLYSFTDTGSTVKNLLAIDSQEIARYFTWKAREPLEPAMTRAVGATAVFMVAVALGYHLPVARRVTDRIARLGKGTNGRNVRAMVAGGLVIGLLAQVVIVARVGGLAGASDTMLSQRAAKAGIVLFALAGFAPVAMLVWATWRRPASRWEWLAIALAGLEVVGFYGLIGSRSGVFSLVLMLAVAWHYRWRAWRTREAISAVVFALLLSAALLGVRQSTSSHTFVGALRDAPQYIVDPRGILNDNIQFDTLLIETTAVGHGLHFRDGGWLVDAVRANLPGFLDPGKPAPGDVVFRREIWGNEYGAGRPVTLVGDFYYDFGFAGIAVGALLFGWLASVMRWLVAPRSSAGRGYRVGLYAIGIYGIYSAVATTYSLVVSLLITLLVPYLVTVHLIGRLPQRLGGRLSLGTPAAGERSGGSE